MDGCFGQHLYLQIESDIRNTVCLPLCSQHVERTVVAERPLLQFTSSHLVELNITLFHFQAIFLLPGGATMSVEHYLPSGAVHSFILVNARIMFK